MKTRHALLPVSLLGLVAAGPALGETVYALQDVGTTQELLLFDTDAPGSAGDNSIALTGLGTDERVLGIDFRPQTGELFALGNSDAIYTIDRDSGEATLVGSGFTDSLSGSFFGFDFNPTIDRIRIVSDVEQNFVANPNTGDANVADTTPLFFADGDVNEGANPNVVNSAYTNSVPDAVTTQLFGIDTDLDILVTQANNAGTLGTVGELGFDILTIGGFDISGDSGVAFLAATIRGDSGASLLSIDLETGAATSLGTIGSAGDGFTIDGLTAAPVAAPNVVPTPSAALAGLAMLGLVTRRRRRA